MKVTTCPDGGYLVLPCLHPRPILSLTPLGSLNSPGPRRSVARKLLLVEKSPQTRIIRPIRTQPGKERLLFHCCLKLSAIVTSIIRSSARSSPVICRVNCCWSGSILIILPVNNSARAEKGLKIKISQVIEIKRNFDFFMSVFRLCEKPAIIQDRIWVVPCIRSFGSEKHARGSLKNKFAEIRCQVGIKRSDLIA